MKAAIYSRYSTERQNDRSIDDQQMICREAARKNGWEVVEECVYADKEESGYGFDRPDFRRLLESAKLKTRNFDILLIESTSRLGRNVSEVKRLIDELYFNYNLPVFCVTQNINTGIKADRRKIKFLAIPDEAYIDAISDATFRGLQGQLNRGFIAGGRMYGFDVKKELDEKGNHIGSKYVINDKEIEIVRRIFNLYVHGNGLKRIARLLNDEGVPSPRGGYWQANSVRGLLMNTIYIGQQIWNKREYFKLGNSNKRISRPKPKEEWKVISRPEMKIVEEEVFYKAQKILAANGEKTRRNFGGEKGTPPSKLKSLLSGLITCGECGGNYIKYGKDYICKKNYHKGGCKNGNKINAEYFERDCPEVS